eukprot:CAMPEP_0174831314 /NCGR_PEP_ID=MMETSP1114-20130205/3022_1 /TAXON_ID=312471 /ORGANISM="Neobodo designis, Strain CCAP 1951/1" /LENGTH=251 /DNA_ID=CAMNT_0016065135 /DNA_START=30 /DNA_END=785 /DNA_ORIENTATION=+
MADSPPTAPAVEGASARRREPLAIGPPMPFDPLPDGYTPTRSCKEVFLGLCPTPSGGSRWEKMAAGLEYRAQEAHDDVGASRDQSLDEVFAVTAYTADAQHSGFAESDSVYFRLNAILRNRNIAAFEPFKDFYCYLLSALRKIPQTEVTVWRGMANVTLEQLGRRYEQGRTVCLLAFSLSKTGNFKGPARRRDPDSGDPRVPSDLNLSLNYPSNPVPRRVRERDTRRITLARLMLFVSPSLRPLPRAVFFR